MRSVLFLVPVFLPLYFSLVPPPPSAHYLNMARLCPSLPLARHLRTYIRALHRQESEGGSNRVDRDDARPVRARIV